MFDRRFGGAEKPTPSPDRTEEILRRHVDGDFVMFPMAERTTDRSEVYAIGERVGVQYPPEYAAHLSGRFPGIYVEVKESVWPRPKELDVGPFWSFLYAFHTYTAWAESEPWMRLETAAEAFQESTQLPFAPVLRVVGDGNLICVDDCGAFHRFDHETHEMNPLEGDFWTIFEDEVRDLRQRKDRRVALKQD